MKSALLIVLSLLLTGCFKTKATNPFHQVIELKQDSLHLAFGHNINGETHPCGCRHFPLGGLPQIAGQLNELKKSGEVMLLDTGDLLFPSSNLPDTMRKSFTYAAENLSKGMDLLGLRFFVPGDQDFALGIDFLKGLLKEVKYQLLISNLSDPALIAHKRIVILNRGEHKVFLIGLIDPSIMQSKAQRFFTKTFTAMKKILPELKTAGFDDKNPKHRLILLSHSGMPSDQALAKEFPQIDWVLGAHSQNFTKLPYEEGTTKLVQVLSRNHYLGGVNLKFNGQEKDSWLLHEIRDEFKSKLSPNPFEEFIKKHKEKVKTIQVDEQSTLKLLVDGKAPKMNTASSCLECHEKQVNFWAQTPHSIAYATLINHTEDKNLNCIGCHSVGLNSVNGFNISDEIISIDPDFYEVKNHKDLKLSEIEKLNAAKLAKIKKNYWHEVGNAFKGIKSIRELPKAKVLKLSKTWMKLDEKNKVTHNFANVQCLNCHGLELDHPFAIPPERSAITKHLAIKEKCLNCHVPDQSPEWYEKQENGLPGRALDDMVEAMIEKVSCPKRKE